MQGKGTGVPPAEETKWGTQQMGAPAEPPSHPENQQAATHWGPHRGDEERPPYVLIEPSSRQATGGSPMESILEAFNSWTRSAETLAGNVWQNLRTATSMTDAAWGKVSLTAKALTEGGFETIYRQTFSADPSDRVKKSFACYLSTNTGPVAGTLYLTTANVAFCSDRPLKFKAPSGQDSWSFYKVLIPLGKIASVSPVTAKENPPEKYIHVVTVDGHEFWFMGFVSYDKASTHLLNAVHDHAAGQTAGQGPTVQRPAGEWTVGQGPSGERQAGEWTTGQGAAGERPAGEWTAGQQTAGRPAGEWMAGQHPAGQHPAGQHPAGQRLAGEHPPGEWPAGERPSSELPAGEQSAAVKPQPRWD